jgi:hypothetical protein
MTTRSHQSRDDVSDPYSPGYNPSSPHYDPTRDPSSSTYIDRRHTTQTGQETQQDAENQVDQDVENGTFVDKMLDWFNHGNRVEDTYTQDMNAQAAELAQGVQTRPGPLMMCANYMATPHPQLKTMVTEDVSPDGVGETGDLWISAGNAMTRFQSGVASAITNSESDWQGSAGNSARTFMAQVGNWVGEAGQSAQLAGTQTNLQATALAQAKRSMPEPVDFDIEAANADLQSEQNPFALITKLNQYQAQYDAQQAAHEQAATVVGTYDSSLSGASTMPAFGKPPTLASSSIGESTIDHTEVGTTNPNEPGVNNPNGTYVPPGSNDPNTPGGRPNTPTVPPGTGNPNNPGGPGGPNGPGGSDLPGGPDIPNLPGNPNNPGGGQTTPSGDLPNPPGLPGPGQQYPGQYPGPSGGGNQFGQNPAVPPLPVGGLPGPNGGGEYGRTGSGPGTGGRYGGGSGGFGPGGPGAGGSGSGGPGAGGRGPGVGGLGSGGMAEGGPVRGGGAVGAAGRGGAGGMGGGGMGGGRRGEGDEDDEHKRASYLVEGDPDAVFGTDQMTAPPVIGE